MTLRSFTVLATLLVAFGTFAQAPSYVFFRTEVPMDRAALKQVVGQVQDIDPLAEVFYSDDMTIIQVKRGLVTDAQIRAAIAQAGVVLRPGTVDPAELAVTTTDRPPVYLVTNDPAADLLRYQTAVAEWNAAHPDQQVSAVPTHVNQ